jgi:hypothetical protein
MSQSLLNFRKTIRQFGFLIGVLISFSMLTPSAKALTGELCITSPQNLSSNLTTELNTDQFEVENRFFAAPRYCQSLKPVQTGLKVVTIGIGLASIASMCGVVSAPISVGLGIAGVVTGSLDATISLVCDDESVSKEDVANLICQKFAEKGMPCDNNTVIRAP